MSQSHVVPRRKPDPEPGYASPWRSSLGVLARIFRFEYLAATFPGLSITLFLCGRSPDELLRRAPLEGLVVVALIIFSCLGINAIVDREIDAQYLTEKSRIAIAVGAVGAGRIWTIIAVMNVVALVLTIDLCIQFQSWIPLLLTLSQALFAYGYSVPPLKFKLRGVLVHAISLALAVCGLPFILSAYTYLGGVPATLAFFIFGFSMAQYGFEFANQALDYQQDMAAGLKTPAVRLGVERSLQASLAVPLAGMAIMSTALMLLYLQRSQEISSPPSIWKVVMAWGISVLVLVAGNCLPLGRTWQMLQLCRWEVPRECVPKFPAFCNYARWQASSVAGVATATAVFFVVTNYVWP
jgi:4-hydroxybenzoate polyprenyltransferase